MCPRSFYLYLWTQAEGAQKSFLEKKYGKDRYVLWLLPF